MDIYNHKRQLEDLSASELEEISGMKKTTIEKEQKWDWMERIELVKKGDRNDK